jgi:hypothetical protein
MLAQLRRQNTGAIRAHIELMHDDPPSVQNETRRKDNDQHRRTTQRLCRKIATQ